MRAVEDTAAVTVAVDAVAEDAVAAAIALSESVVAAVAGISVAKTTAKVAGAILSSTI